MNLQSGRMKQSYRVRAWFMFVPLSQSRVVSVSDHRHNNPTLRMSLPSRRRWQDCTVVRLPDRDDIDSDRPGQCFVYGMMSSRCDLGQALWFNVSTCVLLTSCSPCASLDSGPPGRTLND